MPPPRPTNLGLVAASLAATTAMVGLVLLSGPILAVGLAATALLLLCRLLAARHLDGFEVERDLPRRTRAGESFPMEIRVRPGSRFPTGMVARLTDPLAPAVRDRPLGPARTIHCTGLSHRRGPLPPRPWTLVSTWPLGLFLTERQGSFRDDHATLVLPQPWLPPHLRERLDRLSSASAERPLEPADPLAEFRLLREFRSGDPVRGIRWPASLRSGRLLFAETEPPRPKPTGYGLVLHSYERPGSVVVPETYEQILRIATGLLLRFQREEIPTVFCQAPGTVERLASHAAFAERIDALALSRRLPLSSLDRVFAAPSGDDPFRGCDEVFVLGDGPLAHWEDAACARFPRCTCLDPATLTTHSRPALLVRSKTSPL